MPRLYYDFTGRAEERHISPQIVALLEGLRDGTIKLSREEKRRNSHKDGVYRLMGWLYDFRPFMTKYVVKTDHYLEEVYAFDKTCAREAFKGLGKVKYIVEVPK